MRFKSFISELTGRTVEMRLMSDSFDDERLLESIRVLSNSTTKHGSISVEHDKSEHSLVWEVANQEGSDDEK